VTLPELLDTLDRGGLCLRRRGDGLVVAGGTGPPDPALLAALRDHEEALQEMIPGETDALPHDLSHGGDEMKTAREVPGAAAEPATDGTAASWTFDGQIVDGFVAHIRRSVPLYDAGHDLVCQIADYFVHDGSVCYELGVSTGELMRKLVERHAGKEGVRWIGIDPVARMIAKAEEHCRGLENVNLIVGDAVTFEYEKADLIVSYYCAQFTHPKYRQDLFDRIYERLNWGGALIMFEKVRGADARFQDMLVSLYNDFKVTQGFDADEILNKTRSLRGVLEPFSREGNLGLLRRAGFTDIETVMKYLCFEGFVAIK
jgi:tRNA (cmo5U34)-methyltransferase